MHTERGGADGGTVILTMNAGADGVLFEYFDDYMENGWTLTIREYADTLEKGAIHGVQADGPAAAAK